MGFWYYFWTANLLIAGSAFALITVIVLVRGSKDLLDMFARLRQSTATDEPDSARAEEDRIG